MEERFAELLQKAVRQAGRKAGEIRIAYIQGRETARDRSGADRFDLPVTEKGDAKIVCRRHAEQRAVPVDQHGSPSCFEREHVDCEGCVEDICDGHVETW